MATMRKRTVKRPVGKKTSAKKSGAKKVGARKSAAKKTTAKKATAKKATARKSAAKKSSAMKAGARKPGARKNPALAEYNRKRDFTRTGEPAGEVPRASGKALHFVVQKHAASRLHYDVRLELDGVMKSWAVPKGPSYDPKVRRLAMEVEDHPITYNTFEGTIPAGEYGGGTVMLWDHGTYEAEDGGGVASLRRGYEKGDLKFVLHGERLRGGWVLVRMNRPGRAQWLLIKHRDATADPDLEITEDATTSVSTDRTMDEIAAGRRTWHSDR
jgi:bifunctional non-homologous end joining protein LigD